MRFPEAFHNERAISTSIQQGIYCQEHRALNGMK